MIVVLSPYWLSIRKKEHEIPAAQDENKLLRLLLLNLQTSEDHVGREGQWGKNETIKFR